MVLVAVTIAATAVALGGTPSAARTYAGTLGSVGKHRPSQATVARKLAVRVTSARTPAERYNAILAVMRSLHVGVFTGKGKVLVRAGRPHELYLYDFELKAMADVLGRGQTTTAADIAGQLTAAGVQPGGRRLTVGKLAQTLGAGTRAALARPNARASLGPLLVRELGLRHRPAYNLAAVAPGKLRFDALQVFVIDASVAVVASSRGGGAIDVASSAAAGPCDSQAGDVVTDEIPLGKWVISLVGPIKDVAKVASLVLDAIHGSALAFSVAVAPTTPTSAKTHYGPAGHEPDAGKPFDFGVRVVMRDQLPRFVISCGPLLGMKFPEKGPIPGVLVAWKDESAIAAPLVSHGTEAFPTGRKTNANGETTLHFVPKDEKVPGFGTVHYSGNAATAAALYQSAFKNVPGSVAQFLTPKSVTFDWSVSFHLARGFKFAGTVAYGFNNDRQLAYDMHVCGDDPYGAPWTGKYTYVGEPAGTRQAIWPFVPGLDISPVEAGGRNIQMSGQLGMTKPFSVHLTLLSEGQTDSRSLPLEEDLGCPDNTPFGSSP